MSGKCAVVWMLAGAASRGYARSDPAFLLAHGVEPKKVSGNLVGCVYSHWGFPTNRPFSSKTRFVVSISAELSKKRHYFLLPPPPISVVVGKGLGNRPGGGRCVWGSGGTGGRTDNV